VLSRTEGFESTEVDFKLAFWTATLGSAAAIGLEDHLGSFGTGKQFDALLVSSEPNVYDIFPEAQAGPSSLRTDFERFVNLGDDRNVRKVYVRGRVVHTAP
jgi:guanine deaminase